MSVAGKTEISATGFAPHIEELHEFFRSRGVAFGKPDDLAPFVDRVSKDESFRDEMASMVRAIIYRERDGLTPVELMELLLTAVGGTPAEEAPEHVRGAVRQMLGFVGGVFRSRWNPGSPVAPEERADVDTKNVTEAPPESKAEAAAAETVSAPAEVSTRPTTPIFYQAQVVANGGEEPKIVDEPVVTEKQAPVPEEIVLPLRGKAEARGKLEDDDGPTFNFAGYAKREPVVAFLRGEGSTSSDAFEPERSRGGAWVAIVLAIVVSFGAGMFARQWMFTRYGAAWPWHMQAVWTAMHRSAPSTANSGVAQPGADGAGATASGTAAQPRKQAQVEATQSAWQGGSESASDLGPPVNAAAAGGAQGESANPVQGDPGGTSLATDSSEGSAQPEPNGAKPSPEVRSKLERSARVTAMVGASPALMASHLLFAPEPEYPNLARIAHIQGPVLVEALVGRDGSVVRAQAISGHRMLRGAAEEAVYGRRYKPYVVDGVPMAVRTLVTVNFRLR